MKLEDIQKAIEEGLPLEVIKREYVSQGGDALEFEKTLQVSLLGKKERKKMISLKLLLSFFLLILLILGVGIYFFKNSGFNMSKSVYNAKFTKSGWGDIKLGTSKNDVEIILGKAEKVASVYKDEFPLNIYSEIGLIAVYDKQNILVSLVTHYQTTEFQNLSIKPFNTKFNNSLSSRTNTKKALAILGEPDEKITAIDIDSFNYGNLTLHFEGDKLNKIVLLDPEYSRKIYETLLKTKQSNLKSEINLGFEGINSVGVGDTLIDLEKIIGKGVSDGSSGWIDFPERGDISVKINKGSNKIERIIISPTSNISGYKNLKIEPALKFKNKISFYKTTSEELISKLGKPDKTQKDFLSKEITYNNVSFFFTDGNYLTKIVFSE